MISSGNVSEKRPLFGNSSSQYHSVFTLDSNEFIVAVDICATDVVGAIRFITSNGVESKWYGKGIVKPYFRIGDEKAGKGKAID